MHSNVVYGDIPETTLIDSKPVFRLGLFSFLFACLNFHVSAYTDPYPSAHHPYPSSYPSTHYTHQPLRPRAHLHVVGMLRFMSKT